MAHSKDSLPAICLEQCNAANSDLCELLDAFSPECEGPVPSTTGVTTSEVRFVGDPLTAEDVPRVKAVSAGTLVCRNSGLNNAVNELIALTNENEGRLF